ncbi:MAG: response regulator [Opitutae bacterium]|nr:response regulator [Opitutae bacterium]
MKTILVVDDFASVRLYHTSFLKQKGYACIDACDGAEALAKLPLQPVDLILLDLVMPKMNGGEFLARLRAMPDYAHTPILAITSEALKERTKEYQQTFGIEALLKPVRPDELLRKVQQFLN